MCLFIKIFRDDPLAQVSIPFRGENRVISRSLCSMAPTSNRLLGNNGWPQALFATVGECRHPRTLLQWLDAQPLHHVRILLLFGQDNCNCFFNVQGLVHDSQVAEYGNIYGKLEDVFWLTGAKCSIDTAFGQVNREYLNKSSQDLFGSLASTCQERKLELRKTGRKHWRKRQLSGEYA